MSTETALQKIIILQDGTGRLVHDNDPVPRTEDYTSENHMPGDYLNALENWESRQRVKPICYGDYAAVVVEPNGKFRWFVLLPSLVKVFPGDVCLAELAFGAWVIREKVTPNNPE